MGCFLWVQSLVCGLWSSMLCCLYHVLVLGGVRTIIDFIYCIFCFTCGMSTHWAVSSSIQYNDAHSGAVLQKHDTRIIALGFPLSSIRSTDLANRCPEPPFSGSTFVTFDLQSPMSQHGQVITHPVKSGMKYTDPFLNFNGANRWSLRMDK